MPKTGDRIVSVAWNTACVGFRAEDGGHLSVDHQRLLIDGPIDSFGGLAEALDSLLKPGLQLELRANHRESILELIIKFNGHKPRHHLVGSLPKHFRADPEFTTAIMRANVFLRQHDYSGFAPDLDCA